eukprot:gene43070-52636_t
MADIESQYHTAVPATSVAEPVQATPYAGNIIRVYEIPVGMIPQEQPPYDPQAKFLLPCAIVGCMFSWIPIVGCLTYAINCNAPARSARRAWATTACTVATNSNKLVTVLSRFDSRHKFRGNSFMLTNYICNDLGKYRSHL